MRWLVLGWLAAAACGERSSPTPTPTPAPATGVRITPIWHWGPTPTDEGGPRMERPTDPPPVGAVAIAAGRGKVVVATRAGCLELLDGTSGASLGQLCKPGTFVAGLAVVGDVALVARATSVQALSLADLSERWQREVGAVQTNHQHARPGVVDGRFCVVASGVRSLGVTCLDPATGAVAGTWQVPTASAIAFGDRRIAVVPRDRMSPTAAPAPGLALPIELRASDGKLAATHTLAGTYGPTLEQGRPIFVIRGGGYQSSWTHLFLDADGKALVTQSGRAFLRGGVQAGDLVLTSDYGGALTKDHVIALRAPDQIAWQVELGVTGPWDAQIRVAGHTAIVAHDGAFALDLDTRALAKRYPFDARRVALWRDRVAFLVEERETRSDSNRGDAGVYAIELATREVVLRDDVGRDVPGGQLASEPVFDGDAAYVIAGGRAHAYRIAP